jgi:hypothetical protein
MAIEIDDRGAAEPINIDLRMLRYQIKRITGQNYQLATEHAVAFQTAQHWATSILGISDGRITLTQKYQEEFQDLPAYYDASAVAIGVVGRPSRARYRNYHRSTIGSPGRAGLPLIASYAISI